MNRLPLLLLCLLAGNVFSPQASLYAQDLQETLRFAHQQYQTGQYELALKTYRRVLFFGHDSIGAEVFEPLAACYVFIGKPNAAQKYLDLAYANTADQAKKNELLFRKATAYLFAKEPQFALLELLYIESEEAVIMRKQAFYLGLAYFQAEQFEQAEASFLSYFSTEETESRAAITALFQQNKRLDRRYNPKTAMWMSIFLPGLGQLYIGEFEAALNSMVLVGGLVVLFGYTANTLGVIDAMVSVMPWYQRYFFGGSDGASRLASEKIQRKRAELYQQVLSRIQASSSQR